MAKTIVDSQIKHMGAVLRSAHARIIARNIKSLADSGDTDIEKPEDEDNDESNKEDDSNNSRRLKVLVDADAQKLVMKTYSQYVSDKDFSDLVGFIQDFDALLAKYRKGKPMTEDEIEKAEQIQGKGGETRETDDSSGEGEAEEPDPEKIDEEEPDPEEGIEEDEDEAEEPQITISSTASTLAAIMAKRHKG